MSVTTAASYRGNASAIGPALASLAKSAPGSICLVRATDELKFVRPSDIGAVDGTWIEGRCFSDHAELRWARTESGAWRALLVADEPAPTLPDGFAVLSARLEAAGDQTWHLWGERTSRGWREDRVPRDIQYLGVDADRVALKVMRYRVDSEPVPSVVRYCRLVAE